MKAQTAALILFALNAPLASGQNSNPPPLIRRTCPGDPPGNLASTDCSFTIGLRFKNLVTGSMTDQAILSAVLTGAIAEVQNDPKEWGRGWSGFGQRIGIRYGQTFARGVVEFGFGEAMQVDPRHVSYASDPRVKLPPTVGRRIGHAFLAFLTVRRSSIDGGGRPLPNIPLFAGAAAGAFAGDPWYPASAKTTSQVVQRAGGSLATDLAGSFYTEFSPELGKLLGGIFKRGKTTAATKAANTPKKGSD